MEEMLIGGYPIVFNQKTLLYEYKDMKFYEIIDPSALYGADISDVVLRYNHDSSVMMAGTTKNKSVKLFIDSKGLRFECKLPNTTQGRDLYELVKGKYLSKMSFAFLVDKEEYDESSKTRIIRKFKRIIDISIVDFPAYPQTSVYVIDDEQKQRNSEIEAIRNEIKQSELEYERKKFKREANQREIEFLRNQIKNRI